MFRLTWSILFYFHDICNSIHTDIEIKFSLSLWILFTVLWSVVTLVALVRLRIVKLNLSNSCRKLKFCKVILCLVNHGLYFIWLLDDKIYNIVESSISDKGWFQHVDYGFGFIGHRYVEINIGKIFFLFFCFI